MFTKLRKYAPVGLVIGLITAAAALILRISAGQFTLTVKILIGVALLGMALFVALDPQSILATFKGRKAKYSSNATILTLAVIGILVIINLFLYHNDVSWDLTEDKVNTLSPESLEILQDLEIPIYAQAFYSASTATDSADKVLSNFKRNSNGMFDYEFIDPYQDPVAANQAGITRDQTIILSTGEQSEPLSYLSEENLLNGIVKLQNPETTVVYVLTGHGEDDFFETGDFSMTSLRTALEAKNYTITALNLVATPTIPEDAKAIIIAAPQVLLDESEIELLRTYLDKGGSLVLFSEPPLLTQVENPETNPLWTYLQENWGIRLGNNLVIDLSVDPVELAVADQYAEHAITDEVQGYITFYPTSHSVDFEPVEGITATDLVLTTSQSWAETDLDGINQGQVAFDETDTLGPINLVAAFENPATGARVVVVGDSDFASDTYVDAYGNRDLSVSIVDWASANENLINLTTAETTTRVLVPPTRAVQLLIFGVGQVGLPLLIVTIGVIVAVRRKRTG
jgi:ABC-type uncharacterized transport system involved in gliding motility auxiliary subunit